MYSPNHCTYSFQIKGNSTQYYYIMFLKYFGREIVIDNTANRVTLRGCGLDLNSDPETCVLLALIV